LELERFYLTFPNQIFTLILLKEGNPNKVGIFPKPISYSKLFWKGEGWPKGLKVKEGLKGILFPIIEF